ncbi:MAG: hypothetical protein FWB80_00075 [Defluviitaleaceae bacterium]|nr:hypothetical protein [Defluviitaleaceae bacterium]
MNGIIRVFPQRTSYTPDDNYIFVIPPKVGQAPDTKYWPEHKEIHISCTFTWDKSYCEQLAHQFSGVTNKPVKLGGAAFNSPADDFIPGMYIKKNIVFTTRGCNNNCPHCCVPRLEGRIKELPIHPGNIIQDNNFLQASRAHKDKVFKMLSTQKSICFKGGLSVECINDHFINAATGLRISELWLACDTDEALPKFKIAAEKLKKAGFSRDKIRCYALVGKNRDKDEARLREIYHAGALPMAMLFRDFSDKKTKYDQDTEKWARSWIKLAAVKAKMEKGTDYRNFSI